MGLETVAVDADPNAPCVSLADRFERIDLKDKEGIEALARSLQEEGRLGGIMTAGTDFSASVAWVAERLGLPGLPYTSALNASDKGRMRRCFAAAGVPSPAFVVLTEIPKGNFTLPFAYPAVVKPVDNMGGRGCRRVDSPADLEAALPEALKFSRSGRVIVEEYMDGPEFSVDALIYRGQITICGLADRHIYFPPYFLEMGHTMPTAFGEAETTALLKVFTDGARALGLLGEHAAGAAKGDLKLSSRGPMIGEIAARLSGGYMSGWTFPYASGVELTRAAILVALGRSPDGLEPRRSWTSAERAFISIPGTVRSLHFINEAASAPHVKDLFLRAEAGGRVRFPENNVSKCGNIITAASDRETAVTAAESAARQVLIRLEAPDGETEAFLAPAPGAVFGSAVPDGVTAPVSQSGADAWRPPDAFPVPPDIAALLAELPDPAAAGSGVSASGAAAKPAIIPFPAFSALSLRDHAGRTIEESLEAVRTLTGYSLPIASPAEAAPGTPLLGRGFWAALIRGGYQGAAYFIDKHLGGA
jgi:biotin carboxylase